MIAKEIGTVKCMNMVMLGAASPYLDLPVEKLKEGIRTVFSRKGEKIVNMNLEAFDSGRKAAENK